VIIAPAISPVAADGRYQKRREQEVEGQPLGRVPEIVGEDATELEQVADGD
jgi:hypothetical protein